MAQTEITPEIRARFFARYWGQNVLRKHGWTDTAKNSFVGTVPADNYRKDTYVELTPLSAISDEDKIPCALITGITTDSRRILIEYGRDLVKWKLRVEVYQYLQSKGYALPWYCTELRRIISVDEQVEKGLIKLKSA